MRRLAGGTGIEDEDYLIDREASMSYTRQADTKDPDNPDYGIPT